MLHSLLNLVGALILAAVAIFFLGIIVLMVVTIVQAIKREMKGGRRNDSNPKP